MFEIVVSDNGNVELLGRFDATQVERARDVLGGVTKSTTVDCKNLDYISSAGLGVLLAVQKRLGESGEKLQLANLNSHIREIFRIAGFDQIFEIT